VNGIHAMYDSCGSESYEKGWKRVSRNGHWQKVPSEKSKQHRNQRKHKYRKDQKQFQQNSYHDQRPKRSNKE